MISLAPDAYHIPVLAAEVAALLAGARSVRLQGHAGKRWQTLATARTGRSGRFTLGYQAQSGTNRRLRVLFGGDAAHARASASAGKNGSSSADRQSGRSS